MSDDTPPSDNTPPSDETPSERPSGLRNPAAAVRGVGAGALVAEALVLVLAIVPLHVLGAGHSGATTAVIVVLAVACVVLCGMLRRAWAWYAAAALQLLLFVSGFFLHPSLAVLGVLFGALWAYVLTVRRRVAP